MKVKNIVFSGVMAAILGATGAHAAEGDQIQLISKTYADNNLQAKLTAGTGIKIDNGTISADMTAATVGDKTVVQVLDSKADASSVETLEQKIGELPTSGEDAAATIVEYINKKTTGIATNAALGELQGDVDALELKVGNDTVANQITAAIADKADRATSLSGYGITDAYTKAEVDATVETLATKTELAGYATDDELTAVSNVANAAATKTYVDEELGKKANASDLGSYYTKSEADSTFMDSTEVDAKIETATADMASATELAGVNTTAEQGVADAAAAKVAADAAQADADANATAIQGKVDSIGAGKAGSYIINFDDAGKASYTEITII